MKQLPALESLEDMLARLGISNWDIVIVGDGSGSGWRTGSGWAAVLVERISRGRQLLYGGMNLGTVNTGEIMAYVHAMLWYHENRGRDLMTGGRGISVHVITDSQVVCTVGTRVAAGGELPSKQAALWAMLRQMGREGYQLNYLWARRSTTLLNWYTDLVSSLSRKAILDVKPVTAEGEEVGVYDLNP